MKKINHARIECNGEVENESKDCFKTGGQGRPPRGGDFNWTVNKIQKVTAKENTFRKKSHLKINGVSIGKENEARFCVFTLAVNPISTEKAPPVSLCWSHWLCVHHEKLLTRLNPVWFSNWHGNWLFFAELCEIGHLVNWH